MKRFCIVMAGLLLFSLAGCVKRQPDAHISEPAATPEPSGAGPLSGKLMCRADDEKQAREIAELYGIKFIGYAEHIATFNADEDADAVIARGKENGWPELSRNDPVYAFSQDASL